MFYGPRCENVILPKMVRWCKKGPLLAVGVIILIVLGVEFIRGALYSNDSRPSTEETQISDINFFDQQYKLILESRKTIQACDSNDVEVLLIVPSAVGNQDARAAVRESWTALLPSSWLILFFLGSTKETIQQDQVKTEAEKFEDIIQDSRFVDSYYNLTLKTLAILQWTQRYCKNGKFLLKIDDDMYLNIKKLHQLTMCINKARRNMYQDINHRNLSGKEINVNSKAKNVSDVCLKLQTYKHIHYFINANTNEYESYCFGGYLYKGVRADRNKNSKWYLDSKFYSPDVLPPFLSGTAYMLTINLIPYLLNEAKYEPKIVLEDVYISGLIGSNRLKLKLSHIEGWSRFRPQWNSKCLYNDLVTVHGLSPSELLTMTKSVNQLHQDECHSIFVYATNFFNTLISFMFPRVT